MHPRYIPFLCAALLASGGSLCAQTVASAPTTPAGDQPGDSIIELSPFSVSTDRDYGYAATSSLAGSRLNTNLKEIPAVVGTITAELMSDIGGNDIAELASYGTGVYFDGRDNDNDRNAFSPVVIMRGVNGSTSSLARNYFITSIPLDASIIERIEIPRGPNAILYGDGPLGGVINSTTKRGKLQQKFLHLSTQFDDHGSQRYAADANVGTRNVAVRANALRDRGQGWRDASFQNQDRLQVAGTWTPFRNTQIYAEGDWGHLERSAELENYVEQASAWTGAGMTGAISAANPIPAGSGISNVSGTDYWVINGANPEFGLLNYRNFARSTAVPGSSFAVMPDEAKYNAAHAVVGTFPRLPSREFSFNPPDHPIAELDFKVLNLTVDQSIGKLALEVGYNYEQKNNEQIPAASTWVIDVNQQLPNGAPNPHFGEAYTDMSLIWSTRNQYTHEFRAMAAYPFEFKSMKQTVLLSAGRANTDQHSYGHAIRRINNRTSAATLNARDANNTVVMRRYASEANAPWAAFASSNNIDIADVPFSMVRNWTDTDYQQLAVQGRYFDGRISSVLGYRRDTYKQDVADQNSNPIFVGADATVPYYTWRSQNPSFADLFPVKASVNSWNAGAVYFPIKSIGLYGNYSTGFSRVAAGRDVYGNPVEPPTANGLDVGLKLELLNGKLTGSVGYYSGERSGFDNALRSGNALTLNSVLGPLWTSMFNAYTSAAAATTNSTDKASLQAKATDAEALRTRYSTQTLDQRDLKVEGWEADMVANLTKSWRATFNLSLPRKNDSANAFPMMKRSYDENVAEWTRMAGLPTTTANDRNQINNQVANLLKGFADNADGIVSNGTPNYTANLFTRYTFTSGRLRGLYLGGGSQWVGPRVVSAQQVFDPVSRTFELISASGRPQVIKSEAYGTFNALLGYNFKVREFPCTVQLNVNNLFEEDTLRITSYSNFSYTNASGQVTGVQLPNRFSYVTPRLFRLTATVKF